MPRLRIAVPCVVASKFPYRSHLTHFSSYRFFFLSFVFDHLRAWVNLYGIPFTCSFLWLLSVGLSFLFVVFSFLEGFFFLLSETRIENNETYPSCFPSSAVSTMFLLKGLRLLPLRATGNMHLAVPHHGKQTRAPWPLLATGRNT